MGRRRGSLIEDILPLVARAPWPVGVVLAVISFIGFSMPGQAEPTIVGAGDEMGSVVVSHVVRNLALIASYLVPGLLLVGAGASFFSRSRRQRILRDVASPPGGVEQLGWRDFERLVHAFFERRGFRVTDRGGRVADGGIDLELPWKAGSGIVGGDLPGHAFCARIRDRTCLRFVPLDEGEPIDGELGSCLRYFGCDPDTDRVMAPEMAERAFDAWQRARADIHDAWMHETDPANLQPRLRPISRRLRAQLDEHPPGGASSQQVVRWLDIAESPILIREERELRTILDHESLEGAEKSRRLGEAMDELGLEPFSAPNPLPPVSPDEVRLVCWMAVHSAQEGHDANGR